MKKFNTYQPMYVNELNKFYFLIEPELFNVCYSEGVESAL